MARATKVRLIETEYQLTKTAEFTVFTRSHEAAEVDGEDG